MTLADSNVWLALALSKHEFHSLATNWLERNGNRECLFCRATQRTFLRLVTTSAVLAPYGIPALDNKTAWTTYEGFLADKRIAFAREPKGLEPLWKKFSGVALASPKVWMDAYLAAFAVSGGYQLATTDKGFKQYKGLDLLLLR